MLTEKNTYNRLDTSSTNRSTCQQRDEQNKQVRRKLCRNSVLAVCGDEHSVANPLRVSSWSRQAVVVDVLDQKQVVVMRHSQKRYHPSSGAGSQGRGFGGLLSYTYARRHQDGVVVYKKLGKCVRVQICFTVCATSLMCKSSSSYILSGKRGRVGRHLESWRKRQLQHVGRKL